MPAHRRPHPPLAILAGLLASAGMSASPSLAQCDQPAASCQGFTTAQNLSTNGVNGAGNSDVNFTLVADDFYAAAPGPITSVCFWGRYRIPAGSGSTDQAAAAESFRITYYASNAANNAPDSAAILARFTLGGTAPTAGTSLARTGTLSNAPVIAATSSAAGAGPGYAYTATHPPVDVAAGQRIWIEIVGSSSDAAGNNRFRWMFTNDAALAPNADNRVVVALPGSGYDPINATTGTLAFCVNSGIAGTPLPLAPNALCAGAAALTIPSTTAFNGSTARGGQENAPFCKSRIVNGPTLWYTLAGNGTTVTASTCSLNTTFDTVINVYCGSCSPSASNLNCVASNDSGVTSCLSAPGGDPSSVSFVATTGVTYSLAVFGYEGQSGNFDLAITSDNTQAASQPACGSDRCPLTGIVAGIPAANTETDACTAADTNVNCNSPGTKTFALNANYTGVISNADLDHWELAAPLAASTWVRARVNTEFPALIVPRTGPCSGTGTPLNGFFTNLGQQFLDAVYCGNNDYFVQTDASGRLRLLLAANTLTTGLPCAANNAYVFRVDTVAVGGCCSPGEACTVVPQSVCIDRGGNYFGDATTCAVAVGRPDLCAPALCCRGATCATVAQSYLCASTASPAVVGALPMTLAACNASGNARTPCCHADFDKNAAVSIDDIFIYLNAWFAASPYSKIGGDGVTPPTIDDIFVYLNAWFAGC